MLCDFPALNLVVRVSDWGVGGFAVDLAWKSANSHPEEFLICCKRMEVMCRERESPAPCKPPRQRTTYPAVDADCLCPSKERGRIQTNLPRVVPNSTTRERLAVARLLISCLKRCAVKRNFDSDLGLMNLDPASSLVPICI